MFCPLFDLPIINRNIYDLPGILYQMDHGTSRNKNKFYLNKVIKSKGTSLLRKTYTIDYKKRSLYNMKH
ncbi:hypothetical protein CUM49_05820 [Enterococcus faecalis]|nr:hypothetical protein [Enterococcus faecalis]PQD67495.1 hypothetical protein CUM49_05820 [Enterococcus faecalis]